MSKEIGHEQFSKDALKCLEENIQEFLPLHETFFISVYIQMKAVSMMMQVMGAIQTDDRTDPFVQSLVPDMQQYAAAVQNILRRQFGPIISHEVHWDAWMYHVSYKLKSVILQSNIKKMDLPSLSILAHTYVTQIMQDIKDRIVTQDMIDQQRTTAYVGTLIFRLQK